MTWVQHEKLSRISSSDPKTPPGGDERERAVLLEGYAYIYSVMAVALWILSAVAAWFIPIWVTIGLWLVLIVPAMEWQRFAKARGVDAQSLVYARASRRRVLGLGVITGACSVSMALAVILEITPSGDSATIVGAIVGGVAGGTAAYLFARHRAKRSEIRRIADDLDS
ncbi:hypothetical protein [Gordonia sp. NPDC003950]